MSDEEAAGLLGEGDAATTHEQGWRPRLRAALREVPQSSYFWANVVYVVYTCQALGVDYCSVTHPDVLAPAPAPAPAGAMAWVEAPQCAETGDSPVYRQYVALAAMHLVNAFQYLWLWRPWFRENAAQHSAFFLACILAPELLNITEAALYLHTSLQYEGVQKTPRCMASPDNPTWFACPELLQLHAQELYASLIELVASFLWFWSWASTAEHGLPGRGYSLWDLDLHSSYLLIAGSLIYTVYNYQITFQPQSYGSNTVYKAADVIYFVGAALYMFASLRDCDCWFWVNVPWHPARRAQRTQRPPRELQLADAPRGAGGAADEARGGEAGALLAAAHGDGKGNGAAAAAEAAEPPASRA